MNKEVKEFVKFCIVGVLCTAIDAGVFYATKGNLGYRLAMILGFFLSIIANYILNIYWSFNALPTLKNVVAFFCAHCFNIFVVRMLLMYIFVDMIGLSDSVGFIPTLTISVFTNFLIIRHFVRRY